MTFTLFRGYIPNAKKAANKATDRYVRKFLGVWWHLNHIRTIPRSGSTFNSLCNHLERWAVTQRTSNNPQNWPNWGGGGGGGGVVVGACSGMGTCVEMVSCPG